MRRRWIFAPFLFGLFGSTCTHGSLVLALLFGSTGHAGGSGENGHAGAGDTTVDVSIAGAQNQNAPAETATTPPPPPPEEKAEQAIHVEKRVTPPPAPTGSADTTSTGQLAGPVRIGAPNIGFGGDTVEGQRALLPKATTCSDPVAGKWEALKFQPRRSDWVRFTLNVHRASDGTLSGTILSHTWGGTMFDRDPPGCTLGGFDLTVSMNASGRTDTGHITFGASQYSLLTNRCFTMGISYAPDNFSGTIDVARQEFQSLNNDGAYDVNAPYVFRRTGCL